MKQKLAQVAIVVAMAVGGLSAGGSATAQDTQNFGSHVSHCAHAMGGFNGGHNPSMMRETSWAEHTCQM